MSLREYLLELEGQIVFISCGFVSYTFMYYSFDFEIIYITMVLKFTEQLILLSSIEYSQKVVLYLPLIGSLICGFFGRFIGYKGAKILSSMFMVITFISSCRLFYHIGIQQFHCSPYVLGS